MKTSLKLAAFAAAALIAAPLSASAGNHHHSTNDTGSVVNGYERSTERTVPHMVTGSRKDSVNNVRWCTPDLGGVRSSRSTY